VTDGPRVAVLDYGIGNLRSAEKAFQQVGADARLTADVAEIESADGLVLPGVGAFGRCMEALRDSKLDKLALDAIDARVPFMGICVGMQMLYAGSDENPEAQGLGVLDARIRLLPDDVKRPQMQWNTLDRRRDSAMLRGLDDPVWVYFVHSYAAELTEDVVATCEYGTTVAAAVERDRLWATQFHPEKSGTAGLAILRRFVESLS